MYGCALQKHRSMHARGAATHAGDARDALLVHHHSVRGLEHHEQIARLEHIAFADDNALDHGIHRARHDGLHPAPDHVPRLPA